MERRREMIILKEAAEGDVKFEDYHVTRKEIDALQWLMIKDSFKYREYYERGETPSGKDDASLEKQGEDLANAEAEPIINQFKRGEITLQEAKRAIFHNHIRWPSQVRREFEIMYEIQKKEVKRILNIARRYPRRFTKERRLKEIRHLKWMQGQIDAYAEKIREVESRLDE
jgi:hypothetical protein